MGFQRAGKQRARSARLAEGEREVRTESNTGIKRSARSTAFFRNIASFPERWYAERRPPRTRIVICGPRQTVRTPHKTLAHLEVVKLVVDVKAEVFDPLPCTFKLDRKPQDQQRVERVHDETAKTQSAPAARPRDWHALPHSPLWTHIASRMADGVVVIEPKRVSLIRVVRVLRRNGVSSLLLPSSSQAPPALRPSSAHLESIQHCSSPLDIQRNRLRVDDQRTRQGRRLARRREQVRIGVEACTDKSSYAEKAPEPQGDGLESGCCARGRSMPRGGGLDLG